MSNTNVISKQVLFIERAGLSTRSTFNILDAEGYLAESDYGIRVAETESNNHSFEVSGHVVADKFRGRSDANLKSNIQPLSNALHTIQQLTGKSYRLKNDQKTSYGFVAQDVQKVLPDLVGEDIDGKLMLSYLEFIPFLVEAVKDLSTEINQLRDLVLQLTSQSLEFSTRDELNQQVFLSLKPNFTSSIDIDGNFQNSSFALFVDSNSNANPDFSNTTCLHSEYVRTPHLFTDHVYSMSNTPMQIGNVSISDLGSLQAHDVHIFAPKNFESLDQLELVSKSALLEHLSNNYYDRTYSDDNIVTSDTFLQQVALHDLSNQATVTQRIDDSLQILSQYVTYTDLPNIQQQLEWTNVDQVNQLVAAFVGDYDFSSFVTYDTIPGVFDSFVFNKAIPNTTQVNQMIISAISGVPTANVDGFVTESGVLSMVQDAQQVLDANLHHLQQVLDANIHHLQEVLDANLQSLYVNITTDFVSRTYFDSQLANLSNTSGDSSASLQTQLLAITNDIDALENAIYTKSYIDTHFATQTALANNEAASSALLTNTLATYSDTTQTLALIQAQLAPYVLTSTFNSAISSISSSSSSSDINAAIHTALIPYSTSAQVSSLLASYTTTSEITQLLASYTTTPQIEALVQSKLDALDVNDAVAAFIFQDELHGSVLFHKMANYLSSPAMDDYLDASRVITDMKHTSSDMVTSQYLHTTLQHYYTSDELFYDVDAKLPLWLQQHQYITQQDLQAVLGTTVSTDDMKLYVMETMLDYFHHQHHGLTPNGNVTPNYLVQHEYMQKPDIESLVKDFIQTFGNGNVTLPFLQEHFVAKDSTDFQSMIDTALLHYPTRSELSSSYITFTQQLTSSLGGNIVSIGHQLDSIHHQVLGHSTDLNQLSEQVHALANSPHANIDYLTNFFVTMDTWVDHLSGHSNTSISFDSPVVNMLHVQLASHVTTADLTNAPLDTVHVLSFDQDQHVVFFQFNDGLLRLDDSTIDVGQRLLIRNANVDAFNGLFVVQDVIPYSNIVPCSRASDFQDYANIHQALVYVRSNDTHPWGDAFLTSLDGSTADFQINQSPIDFVQVSSSKYGSMAFQDSANVDISGGSIDVEHLTVQHIHALDASLHVHLNDRTTDSKFTIRANDVETDSQDVVFQVDGEGTVSCYQFYSLSDRRLKSNDTPIQQPLELIRRLQGKTFEWLDPAKNTHGPSYGFIAQEVQPNFPSLVSETLNEHLAVDYAKVVPILVEAVKELYNTIQHAGLVAHTSTPSEEHTHAHTHASPDPEPVPDPAPTSTSIPVGSTHIPVHNIPTNIIGLGGPDSTSIRVQLASHATDDLHINPLFGSSHYTLFTNQGANTVDSVPLQIGMHVLIKDSNLPHYNGVFEILNTQSSPHGLFSTCMRLPTFHDPADIKQTVVFVHSNSTSTHVGHFNNAKSFVCIQPTRFQDDFVLDTSPIHFASIHLPLQSMSLQNADDVHITGGTIHIDSIRTHHIHAAQNELAVHLQSSTPSDSFQIINTHDEVVFSVDGQGVMSAHDFYQPSDARLKTNDQSIVNALALLQKLRGVTFDWNDHRSPHTQYGFIAQEVNVHFPSLVHKRSDGFLAVDYSKVVAILVEAVKDLATILHV